MRSPADARPRPAPLHPVVVLRHPREKLSKCSVEPLRGRGDLPFELRFVTWPATPEEALGPDGPARFVRLDPSGPALGPADASRGLLLVDATWRLVGPMQAAFATIPPRSLGPGWRTAYPRSSKLFEDPGDGLATVEALHAALVRLGRPDPDRVLDDYRWAETWRQRNTVPLEEARRAAATEGGTAAGDRTALDRGPA